MKVSLMKITYAEGSTQVINPSEAFDGNYKALAHDIAKGAPHTYKVLGDDTPKKRKR
jgi:hypothetical protein